MSNVIILGTSRNQGNTAQLAEHLADSIGAEIIDLSRYHIQPYDYEHNNQYDDFAPLIERLLGFNNWIFASPIYWYSPSATMKLFIDRLCDLIEVNKSRGRALKGKTASVLATGAAKDAISCFEPIFSETFDYFNMQYKGMLYCCCRDSYVKDEHKEPVYHFAELYK